MSRQPLVHDANQVQQNTEIDIKNTGSKMGQEIFYTDLHWCYNTVECKVDKITLQHKVVPGYGYMLYYTLLGNPGMLFRVRNGCCYVMIIRALFIFLFMNQFAMFLEWENIFVSISIIYILLGVPACILRFKAIKQVYANDSKISYERQFERMILVNGNSQDSLNEFYEINIQQFYSTLQARGVSYQQASILCAKLTQIQAKATIKFMVYQPQWKDISDEAHSDLKLVISYLNLAFPLVTLYQMLILGMGIYYFIFFDQ